MRKSLVIPARISVASSVFAEAPQFFNDQAEARDNAGNTLVSQNIGVQFELRQTAANGPVVCQETQAEVTNDFGLFNLQVGNGTPLPSALSSIDWQSRPPRMRPKELCI